MRRREAARLAGLLVLAVALGGCGFDTVRGQVYPAMNESGKVVTRVAVVPFEIGGDLQRLGPENTTAEARAISKLITRYVTEALMGRGVQVVPADDFLIALASAQIDPSVPENRRPMSNLAAFEFGADGVITGVVTRFRERTGQSLAAANPASVGFRVMLVDAPAARRLWSGTFEETQQPINENVLNMRRYPGGGTRWLTGEELAKWGADEMSKSMPVKAAY
ncbi:MAG: hypothetical protein HKP30_17675 [Myxococcales bacterium]|nr:hypothetical protein [Myxococcales bacterium]